jgi:type I restriction enzyme S subunit
VSRIDDLIVELAPSGVPEAYMGEVGTFIRGRRFTKNDVVPDGIPSIHYGEIYTHYGIAAKSALSHVRRDLADQLRFAEPGDVVIAAVGETVEDVAKAVAWLGTEPVAIHDDTFLFRSALDPKFVSYFMRTNGFHSQKDKYVARAKVKRLSGESLAKIRIPVPPREVQAEIVTVLDRFTELEAGLTAGLKAELEARRRQYVFYRDSLLTFGAAANVQRMSMGELGTLFGGLTGKSKADFTDGNARFVSYVNVFNNIAVNVEVGDYVRVDPGERQRILQRGDILFTGSSETPDDVGMSSVVTADVREPLYLNSFCIGYRLNDPAVLNPEFAKHLFRSREMRRQIVRTASGVTRHNVSKVRLARVEVPFPALSEQRRIAGVLDSFETVVNDLSVGLLAELAARRRQYEYYRDRLLTFEETAA